MPLTTLLSQCRRCAQRCGSQRRNGRCRLPEQLSPSCRAAGRCIQGKSKPCPPSIETHENAWEAGALLASPVHVVQLSVSPMLPPFALARAAIDRWLGRGCACRKQAAHGGDGTRSMADILTGICRLLVSGHRHFRISEQILLLRSPRFRIFQDSVLPAVCVCECE